MTYGSSTYGSTAYGGSSKVSARFDVEKRVDEREGNKIDIHAVRELLGVREDEGATKAMLVTTTYFTRDAKLFLDRHEWELEGREYQGLLEWVNQYLSMQK